MKVSVKCAINITGLHTAEVMGELEVVEERSAEPNSDTPALRVEILILTAASLETVPLNCGRRR